MYSLKLKCRLITPMFMAGADGRTPELRPSEFKGMIRWWWRAIKAEDDIEKLKTEEAKIFGGTGKGEGKSKVKIRILYNIAHDKVGRNLKDEYRLKRSFDQKIKTLDGKDAGIGYLLYSTIFRDFLKDGFGFEILLESFDEFAFNNTVASLWAAIYLGGFGTRARRGGGNIAIESAEPHNIEGINFYCNAKNVDELCDWLKKELKTVKRLLPANTSNSKYTIIKNGTILLFEPRNAWLDALNFIGEKYKNFRKDKRTEIFKTPAFGMPVMHHHFRMIPYKNAKERLSKRWAYPVIFKVIKGHNNTYFPLIIFLNPGGVNLIGKENKINKGRNNTEKFESSILKDFKTTLSATKEVML